jgi:hypothetical protein
MAVGGKRAGAGRPKGSTNRPELRDHFTEQDVKDIIELLKTHVAEDMNLFKFLAEQQFGKAMRAHSSRPTNCSRCSGVVRNGERTGGDLLKNAVSSPPAPHCRICP